MASKTRRKRNRRKTRKGGERPDSSIKSSTVGTKLAKGYGNIMTNYDVNRTQERDAIATRTGLVNPADWKIKMKGIHY